MIMAYFSNGTEGVAYQERYCNRCLHDINERCPIWLLHLLHNSAGANNPEHFLHALIPRTKDGLDNERCELFVGNTMMTLDELQRETLTEKNRRLQQAKCPHEEIYTSTVTGPDGAHTLRFCLDCGKRL
jgi:hypothetical protein